MNRLRSWLIDRLTRQGPEARPLQATDAAFGNQRTADPYHDAANYALNAWVYTAVTKLAAAAAIAEPRVFNRYDPEHENPNHGLIDLIGPHGQPNDSEDSLEFMEAHLIDLDISGNSFWYWFAIPNETPTAVFRLRPNQVIIVPGKARTVSHYIYRHQGQDFPIQPDQLTHFRRPNPADYYRGLPALHAIKNEIAYDQAMASWNQQFFGQGPSVPAGLLVIPDTVSTEERDELVQDLNLKHSQQRRTAVVRAAPGGVAWHSTGLLPKDTDFEAGRMMARKAIFNALDLPEGLFTESSTEAHAKVAERLYLASAQRRLTRTSRKLNAEVMPFFPGSDRWRFEYLALNRYDWEQEKMKYETELLKQQAEQGAQATPQPA